MLHDRPHIRIQTNGHDLRAYDWRRYPGPYTMVPCDGGWVFADVLDGVHAVIQYMWHGQGQEQGGTLMLEYSRTFRTDMRSFDPTSGRMCVIKENGTLVIVDYV